MNKQEIDYIFSKIVGLFSMLFKSMLQVFLSLIKSILNKMGE